MSKMKIKRKKTTWNSIRKTGKHVLTNKKIKKTDKTDFKILSTIKF